jgi:hypothetical protein
MSNELAPLPFEQMQALALSIAKSGMFGIRTPDQAMVLMSIAQAEGRHPALAARDYHIINNSPSKKSEAMLRDFLGAGGRVQWRELSDQAAEATFSHPQGGEATIRWDAARVAQAGLSNPMHKKFPRQMLRSRVVSEGVRTIWPMATGGMYAPEEAAEIRQEAREPIDVTPAAPVDTAADLDAFAAEPAINEEALHQQAEIIAKGGTAELRGFWDELPLPERRLLQPLMPTYKATAAEADEERARDEDPFGLLAAPDEPTKETKEVSEQTVTEAPAVPFGAAVRALTPVAGDDGELDWSAWSRAFVALVEQATPVEARKCRLSDLPHYGKCRTEDGDAARAVLEAVNAKSKEAPSP